MQVKTPPGYRLRDIPGAVWTLGIVSLLMDTSSESIHALLPVYLVSVLKASTLAVGVIEGVAEATASITKVFSGALSDRIGNRKLLAAAGYGLAALSKPLFPLARSVEWVMVARFVDRIGKGVRGAPRDALVADITPAHLRGASFGLRQALDTVGAVIGPLLAMVLMNVTGNRFRAVFWIAVIPAFLSLALITFGVREPEHNRDLRPLRSPLKLSDLKQLGARYWWIVAIATVFALARFSEAFLILRAQSIGLAAMLVPVVMIIMNIVYAAAAYPAGILADKTDRVLVLTVGFGMLIIADMFLALARGLAGVMAGVAIWGLHMGFTQGLLSALVADTAPANRRGTAFGVFNLLGGIGALAASIIAGALWNVSGPEATFLAGSAFTALSLAGVIAIRDRIRPERYTSRKISPARSAAHCSSA
jgi:MFS family permease